ncbi:hypothetical protein A0H81_08682 [Grifola frondosa]|uniref:Uncharacterized protein n=1 Tax=Grifola frondosa TaxID=5627 RepID=A0A1C7M2W7_GRIFR|nr:hypothetical protein A0H81_08682 [Grifola frondosa]
MSHSPVLHRDHEHYSSPQLAPPHGRAPSRSPYQHHAQPEHNGVDQQGAGGRSYIPAGATPPPVPPTFASIMNAYPAPPMASPPAVDAPQRVHVREWRWTEERSRAIFSTSGAMTSHC